MKKGDFLPLTILYNACITEVQAFKDFAENKGVLELLAFSASNKKLARDNDGNILNEGLCSLQKLSTHNATILGRAMDIRFACVYGRIRTLYPDAKGVYKGFKSEPDSIVIHGTEIISELLLDPSSTLFKRSQ